MPVRAPTVLRLVVQQLRDIRAREERDVSQIEVQRLSHPVRPFILQHGVSLAVDGGDSGSGVNQLCELDVVPVDRLSRRLVDVRGVSDLQAKLVRGTTEEILGRVPILVDAHERLSNAVDSDSDSVCKCQSCSSLLSARGAIIAP